MTLETRAESRCCGGTVGFYGVPSATLGLNSNLAVFLPDGATSLARVPVVYCLAGLTCMEETFFIKANALRFAAQHGLALVAPDTSPRGAGAVGEDDSYDLGTGAGFYLDATQAPWSAHYRMGSWLSEELPRVIEAAFPLDGSRRGIMGHSMGGHGALVHGLRAPAFWRSVSAFAPIVSPSSVPWGQKALAAYLGPDTAGWAEWDATALLQAGRTHPSEILIDQGSADQFLDRELRPDAFMAACRQAGQAVRYRPQAGYDHSYWFIQSFIGDHLAHHAAILGR